MSDDEISTANTMRERANESRLKLWLLLGANRLQVTAILAGLFFVAFIVAGTLLYPPLQSKIATTDTIETMFSAMIGAVITGVTLVVTISQLVISQENGPLGDQRQRMSATMDFRTYAQGVTGETIPADPSAFLGMLVDVVQSRANELSESIAASGHNDLHEEMDEFNESVTGNAETVKDQLDGAKFGTFDVLSAALNFNYGWKIFQVERMNDEYNDSLTDEQREQFTELKTSLSMFGPAREHIKTLYFEWALINLSQLILYAALPALFVAGSMLAFVGSGTFTGITFGVSDILWVVVSTMNAAMLLGCKTDWGKCTTDSRRVLIKLSSRTALTVPSGFTRIV